MTNAHRLRPHDVIRAAAAVAIAIVAGELGTHLRHTSHHHAPQQVLQWLMLALVFLVGGVAVRWTALALGKVVTHRTVLAAGAVVRFVTTVLGYVVVLIATLAVAGVSLQRLLIGAGLISVVLGIAAQQSLANIFASLVLLFGRTFNVGDRIVVRSGTLGTLECDVKAIGLTYVTVETETGMMKIPNAVMAASGIGRITTSS